MNIVDILLKKKMVVLYVSSALQRMMMENDFMRKDLTDLQKVNKGICPSCEGKITFQEGCMVCCGCGWGGCCSWFALGMLISMIFI